MVLGYQVKRQPDWFVESENVLKPVVGERRHHYKLWISSHKPSDYRNFNRAHRNARKAVREAKDAWFKKKTSEAERGQFGGKGVWKTTETSSMLSGGLFLGKMG